MYTRETKAGPGVVFLFFYRRPLADWLPSILLRVEWGVCLMRDVITLLRTVRKTLTQEPHAPHCRTVSMHQQQRQPTVAAAATKHQQQQRIKQPSQITSTAKQRQQQHLPQPKPPAETYFQEHSKNILTRTNAGKNCNDTPTAVSNVSALHCARKPPSSLLKAP